MTASALHDLSQPIREMEFALVLTELQEIRRGQHAILHALSALHTQGDAVMAISQEMKDVLTEIDTTTTALGERFTALSEQIKTDMTADEVASVVAQLTSDAAKLKAIGAPPETPAAA